MQLQDDQTYDWTIEPVEFSFQNDFHFSGGLDDLAPANFADECLFDRDFMSPPKEFETVACYQTPSWTPHLHESQTFVVLSQDRSSSPVLEPMQIDSYFPPKAIGQLSVNPEFFFKSWENEVSPQHFPVPSQVKMEPPNYNYSLDINFGEPLSPFGSQDLKKESFLPVPERPAEKKVQSPCPSIPEMPREKSLSTTLNTNHFDDYCLRTEPSFREHPKLLDVSRPFSGPKYSEIFAQFGSSLLVDRHPQLSETDLAQIERTGFMYFLKNVKTIVPKIGPWKFQSHVRGSSMNQPYDTDRSYNLVGSKISIRCKVKEWVTGNDLWRMYHYVPGKSSKSRIV